VWPSVPRGGAGVDPVSGGPRLRALQLTKAAKFDCPVVRAYCPPHPPLNSRDRSGRVQGTHTAPGLLRWRGHGANEGPFELSSDRLNGTSSPAPGSWAGRNSQQLTNSSVSARAFAAYRALDLDVKIMALNKIRRKQAVSKRCRIAVEGPGLARTTKQRLTCGDASHLHDCPRFQTGQNWAHKRGVVRSIPLPPCQAIAIELRMVRGAVRGRRGVTGLCQWVSTPMDQWQHDRSKPPSVLALRITSAGPLRMVN
jgi:hypothetical protein